MIMNKGRVLVVDDEPLVLEILENALRNDGYDVLCAASSQAALQCLERTDFSALVCDVRLEGLDGFDLIGIARRKNRSLGAVLMTGAPNSEDAAHAQNLRVSYLSKPIGMDQLLMYVREATEKSVSDPDTALAG